MSEVTIRELRNQGGSVVDRVAAGGEVTITRAGVPVAQLRPLPSRPASAEALIARWSRLPFVDADSLRADVDAAVDPKL